MSQAEVAPQGAEGVFGEARHWGRLGVTCALTTAVMCAGPDARVTPEATQPEAGQIRYHLTWDWGDAVPDDLGWRVTTDRGYAVHVTEGYLVTYSVQLAPCTEDDLGTASRWPTLFGAGEAWAGHGGPDDPSAWITGLVEPLASPVNTSLTPITVEPELYCRAHYLLARAETGALGLPEDIDMMGTSLYIKGTVARGDEPATTFTIWSTLPTGQLLAWSEPATPIDVTDLGVDVTITRDLGRLFDGVEFATMSTESVEKTILLGLADRLTVELE